MKFNTEEENTININLRDEDAIDYEVNEEQPADMEIVSEDVVNIDFGESEDIQFRMDGRIEGTTDYNMLTNKPKINSVTLIGDKSSNELHLQDEMDYLTNAEIEALLDNFV